MTAPLADASLARHVALDRRLLAAVKDIRVLGTLAWPASLETRLIDDFRRQHYRLPVVEYPRVDFTDARRELLAIERAADPAQPLGLYLRRSAESWRLAASLLEAAGTAAITEPSITLYGRPGDALPGSEQSNLDAARHFVELADELGADLARDEQPEAISATRLRAELAARLDAFFGADVVKVEIDPELTAKAAAGASRIRLRDGAGFTRYDRHQLLAHEAFVHTLTAQNGRAQPHFASLARTAPRATATQEGLAVFAELMSGAIDIVRLKRISLRILAIDCALNGADFVAVYRFFHDHGQGVEDSFHSAQRVFRGAPTCGGAAFTKDNVYLSGLLAVHTFFRWALKNQRMELTRYLFAGKLALADVVALEPAFAAGSLMPPRHLPPWMQHAHGLAGKLAFSLIANRIRMTRVESEDLALPL
ncbi:MAG TPA: flavohemoglobin expression-modulating QEGLA motif protein [Rhodanobacteraceae bacterium]|nr:flavohemoglobin expression-modulating QEGLA motif protein [Rhodanobacteraceae bacterium]